MTVEQVKQGPRQVARTIDVPASADDVFALVADPHRHGELDGSGTVRDTVSGPQRLSQGAQFSVAMKQFGLRYRITSMVTRFEDGRLVEWSSPAGHRWRWELTPLTPTSTRVTETFDYSTVPALLGEVFELLGFPRQNAAGIEATLRRAAVRKAGPWCTGVVVKPSEGRRRGSEGRTAGGIWRGVSSCRRGPRRPVRT